MPALSRQADQALDVVPEIRVASSKLDEVPEIVFARVLKASLRLPGPHTTPAPGSKRYATATPSIPARGRYPVTRENFIVV
jgi:hypothetical protein